MEKRNYGIDLFRIIAALFVTVLHVLGKGGILESTVPGGIHYWAAWFLEIGAYCAVNCFALITGYVMVNKTLKTTSMLGLWFQVFFYSLLISLLFFALLPESWGLTNLVVAVVPIVGNQWWYISSYFALCLFLPFVNTAISNISQQTYRKVLLSILLVVCCLDCFLPGNFDAFNLKNGYSAIWLMIVYLFGAYIRKYNIAEKVTSKKCIVGFLSMILLTFASKITLWFVTKGIFGQARLDDTLVSYISITILLAAIFLLLFCLKLRIGDWAAKVISFAAPAALGVYLIHAHPMIYQYLLKDAFVSFTAQSPIVMILCVIGTSLAIYIVCTALDLLRIQLFKWIRVGRLCEAIARKINGIHLRFFETKLK